MRRPDSDPIGPGQESVWDYPRPPRLEPVPERLRVVFDGITIADTLRGWRVLETSHPPTYYLHPDDIRRGARPGRGRLRLRVEGPGPVFRRGRAAQTGGAVAWAYPRPTQAFAALAGHVAFYAGPMDGCFVGEERVTPQPGGFYGGWITKRIVGPFKGEPGTMGW